MTRAVLELVAQLVVAGVLAVVAGVVDEPLLGVDLHWSVCVGIGLVLVFGGVLIIRGVDDM